MRADRIPVPGLLIAAPASNSGKTVVTLGILRALANRGLSIPAAKAGPDYIDPAFQQAASRAPCLNLDPWAMGADAIYDLARWHVGGDERRFLLCEGVMGLFDGAAGGGGSSADLAAMMGWPVVLVVDVRGQAASAAAVIAGFSRFRPDVQVAGVILNRVGSDRHKQLIIDACAQAVPDIPVLGAVMRSDDLVLPERHLGLVQAGEHPALETFLDRAAQIMERDIDLDALIKLGKTAESGAGAGAGAGAGEGVGATRASGVDDRFDVVLASPGKTTAPPQPFGAGIIARAATRDAMTPQAKAPVTIAPLGHHIAVARDAAFAFCYVHLLAGWQAAGAKISFFSPLADEAPLADCDAIYLPGGYPELHGAVLAAADNFRAALQDAARRQIPVYGECGGYMVLGTHLIDADGIRHAMTGLLPLETSFLHRKLHLGYRQVEIRHSCKLGPAGTHLRGHEFHYASTVCADGPDGDGWLSAQTADGRDLGACGLLNGSVFGSFFHLIC
ncbi:cobyrinate a,c-diamide synthase [Thalassospira mesophila]|uniref:cobyrinate a,c-diamide synthase n=1 Tax=Thalassospira mesophila TaxID=1293891 RepID=UPI003CCC00CD